MRKFMVIHLVWILSITICLSSCAHRQPITKAGNKNRYINKPINNIKTPHKTKQKIELFFPVRGAYVSSVFGKRKGNYHKGVDLAAPMGTPVRTCMKGIVISAGRVKFLQGYGNAVLIKHWNGVYTYYAHLKSIRVKRNSIVYRGEMIGQVGNTGKSRGPHLHLELIINRRNHNPVPYFIVDNSLARSAMLWLCGMKRSVSTGLGLKRLIGD